MERKKPESIKYKKQQHTAVVFYELAYREDRIRTCDTLVPNQVLYQAELLPDRK